MMFSREQLQAAWNELPDRLKGTPFHRARTEGLTLKLETLQPTGSYKIRAAYRLLQKSESRGVALSSSGNFAGAFTWAAAQHGKEAHLVVTSGVNQRKMELAKQHPCTVHVCGTSYESRFEKLAELRATGIQAIDHRTDREVFLGHATIGWECLERMNEFERVLIPVSTGGLALGIASALRTGGFKGEILGVQPSGNPTLYHSWKEGEPVARSGIHTICDALTATSIPAETFQLLQEHLDDILMVQEQSVWNGVGYLALEEGLVAEPGGSVGVAALLEGQRPWKGSLCLLSGRNMESGVLRQGIESWHQDCLSKA
ncbi:MAG: pyridoxal-phosphate dependent enzyme [Candidatus Eremiobacteraeota bacterium]|nr:pyridoxal-phosphate dependent enzyme [Candidatus Eremiobacteraeota bacterium]